MRKGGKIALLIISIIIVGGGVTFGLLMVITSGKFEDSYKFSYNPDTPSPIESIKINSDIGNINIRYNSTPMDHYMDLDVDILVRGPLVEGKSFSDIFKPIVWINESSLVITFSLETKPQTWIFFSVTSKIVINVTLRTDIIFDIDVGATTGDIDMIVPEHVKIDTLDLEVTTGSIDLMANNNNFTNNLKVLATTGDIKMDLDNSIIGADISLEVTTGSIDFTANNNDITNNLKVKATTGDIELKLDNSIIGTDISLQTTTGSIDFFAKKTNITTDFKAVATTGDLNLNFTNCKIGGNIRGKVETGKLTLKTFKMIYTHSSNWDIDATTGDIKIEIYQHSEMMSNVTGTVDTTTGSIRIDFEDTSPMVGSFFTADTDTGDIDYHDLGNFLELLGGFGSLDYITTASYTYTLDLSATTGNINIYGKSI